MTSTTTALEATHCDDCGADLEVGQVGQCEDCLPAKEYKFSELSEKAKDKARDALRYTDHYLHDGWWDGVYEDAGRVAVILGLDITETEQYGGGKCRLVPAINFSGFSSQGDGACFRGDYTFNPKAVDEIKAYCNNEELIRIAEQLYVMQLARRLHGLEPFSANITCGSGSNYYSHSGTMHVEVNSEDDDDDEHNEVSEDLEGDVTQLMCDFADWIYSALKAEHDYLLSDEVVDEQLADGMFDEFGSEL